MDNLQSIQSKLTLHSAAAQIQKVLNLSKSTKSNPRKVSDAEIDLLKTLCKSDNIRICQLASEAFLQLTIEGCLELGQAVGALNMILPHTTPSQFQALSTIIFELLLLDLRRRCISTGSDQDYVCQFDLKPPQHPVIAFISDGSVGCMTSIMDMLTNALDNRDDIIRMNSVEFLRPVLLHLFVNASLFPECQQLWKLLVMKSLTDRRAKSILFEILAWRRETTTHQTCYTMSLLMETLELIPRNDECCIGMSMEIAYLMAAVAKDYIEYNYDPTRCFNLLKSVCTEAMQCDPQPSMDVMLAIAADILSVVSPAKIESLLELISIILPTCGQNSRMLVKEAVIQLLGQPSYTTKLLLLCDTILQTIEQEKSLPEHTGVNFSSASRTVYYHSELAKWTTVCRWWFSSPEAVEEFLSKGQKQSVRLSTSLSQFHRGIYLSLHHKDEVWRSNFQSLVTVMQQSELQAAQSMIPLLYGLAKQKDTRRRLHVLQTMASMGAKESVIGVLKALTKDLDRAICMDLYLRLWKAEPRTYPLLYDLLKDNSRRQGEDLWEHTIARAYTIREVCLIKPQQHGEDLVNLFSEVLSNPNNQENEVAICLSLDAITSLCENHVVNIVSTWKVLGFRFANEKRPRIIKCLCRFFANVPSIKVTTLDQERLVNHIIGTLWNYVTDYDDGEINAAALQALKLFNPLSFTLRQIPEQFRQGIDLPDTDDDGVSEADSAGSVSPDCWIQLILYCNHGAVEAVGELVAYYIVREMESFRGGVYQTPEGRPEPSNLKYLPRASILSSIVNYLVAQSAKFPNVDERVLLEMLRIIAKPFPKPIPPLNWCFLHEYFAHCFEMRDLCLQIAVKQMPYSGTAKRLVENYLKELTETVMLEDDLLKIYTAIGEITEAVQTEIYKPFLHLSLHFLAERAEDKRFSDNSPLMKAMQLIGKSITRKYNNEDNFYHLCVTLESFFLRFDIKSKLFKKYIEMMVNLPVEKCTSLLKPATWPDGENEEKLQKAIYLQFAFRRYNPNATELHFYGLGDIITKVAQMATKSTLSTFFLSGLYGFVQLFAADGEDDKPLINFISELLGLIQCSITEGHQDQQGVTFMLDAFFTAVISFSGYGELHGGQVLAKEIHLRLELFPLALCTLFQQNLWREIEIKIYEFLYHLYENASMPDDYMECLRNALICCKKQPYFQQAKVWPKFVSMRKVNTMYNAC
ncbi:focadhesin [Anopheles ziemanni]|uniref:focadhesin n=1 Tax=Anopheles coustani TaxID=139045 RepID=UPI002659CEAB|nr:focadhesin [Anopheles coustani]XP_058172646.1 focadhesin [Anopheles ziemanni]